MALTESQLEAALIDLPGALASELRAAVTNADFNGLLEGVGGQNAGSLLPLAASFSIHPISGIAVGAVAVGRSGRLYLGANMEFPGMALHASLHAEQSALLNAWMHDEIEVVALHVSETPCGHCRQFLRELSNGDSLEIITGGRTHRLAELLPHAFGETPGKGSGLLDSRTTRLEAARPEPGIAMQRAINAAQRSYVPYSRSPEGFTLECLDGHVFSGRGAECAAFNPTVQSVLTALNQRNLSSSRHVSIAQAHQAKLATTINNPLPFAQAIIRSISKTKIEVVQMEVC